MRKILQFTTARNAIVNCSTGDQFTMHKLNKLLSAFLKQNTQCCAVNCIILLIVRFVAALTKCILLEAVHIKL